MSDIVTRVPCRAKSRAIARPMPEAAPVTRATLPSKSVIEMSTFHIDIEARYCPTLDLKYAPRGSPLEPCFHSVPLWRASQGVNHLDLADGGGYTFFKFMRLVQDIALYACFGCF